MNQPAVDILNTTLTIIRDFKATPEKVFQAWTDPTFLKEWFGPPGVQTIDAQVDLRVGGKYQLKMQEPNGNVIDHGGEYREINPPRNLVFTWVLDGQGCEGSQGQYAETIVTIEFMAQGSGTRLTLTHNLLPGEDAKAGHSEGWIGSLDRLAQNLA